MRDCLRQNVLFKSVLSILLMVRMISRFELPTGLYEVSPAYRDGRAEYPPVKPAVVLVFDTTRTSSRPN